MMNRRDKGKKIDNFQEKNNDFSNLNNNLLHIKEKLISFLCKILHNSQQIKNQLGN